jgi:hypothetical protein
VKWVAFILFSFASAAWAGTQEAPAYQAPQAPVHVAGDDELKVYAAFITQAWAKGDGSGPLAREALLIENDALDQWQPNRRAWEHYKLKKVGGQGRAADEARLAFIGRRQQIIRFYSFPPMEQPVRLVRSDVLRPELKEKGWGWFYGAYPRTQGILSLTAVAFNADGTEALFSARLQCGAHCGYRDLVFMRVVNGEWTMVMKDPVP